MCGRYGFSVNDAKEVYERFEVYNELPDLTSRYNIAPGQLNPVITKHSPNRITRMFWGLIPHWAKDQSFAYKTINARSEDITDKPTYKKPLRYQRCLIPASGFYEWDKSVKPGIPYYFSLRNDSIFAFAGLYDIWKDPKDGKELQSYTIITTKANDLVGKIHHRMPVLLHKEDEEEWLSPDTVEPERILPLLKPYPAKEMKSHQVSRAVNNPKVDSEELIKPYLAEQTTLL